MATRLYLRNTTANVGTHVRTRLSTFATSNLQDGGHAARDLSTTKGSSQTSLVTQTANSAVTMDLYWAKWISDPLTVSTIDANTWTMALAMAESSVNANMFTMFGSIQVLQSDDTVRKHIFNSNTNRGVEFATTEDGQVLTSLAAGLAATGVISTDRLVFELWAEGTISMAGVYDITAYFDGATDVTDTTTTDAAAYIETPQDITFGGGPTQLFDAQQGALSDPSAIQNLGQAVNRSATFCLGEKWARRGRLWLPAPERPFALA